MPSSPTKYLRCSRKIDSLESQHEQLKIDLGKITEESNRVQANIESELNGLRADLQRVTTELAESEAQLPMAIRDDYRRKVNGLGENALASVEEETCGNCYSTLSAQTMSQLITRRPVFCTSCGALMYLADEQSVR